MPVLFIECVCSEAEVRRRLAERGRRGTDVSDADWAVYQRQRRFYQPFEADEVSDRLVADTTTSTSDVLQRIESTLRDLL